MIRPGTPADLGTILAIHRSAFRQDSEADLVAELLEDPTAAPLMSLLAFDGDQATGHALFTTVRLAGASRATGAMILAPLAVIPRAQGQGTGAALITAGLDHAAARGVELVFVLGDPAYYRRFGFRPATRHGLLPPYPVPPPHTDAWMVMGLNRHVPGMVTGQVLCADVLLRPEYWHE